MDEGGWILEAASGELGDALPFCVPCALCGSLVASDGDFLEPRMTRIYADDPPPHVGGYIVGFGRRTLEVGPCSTT